MMVTGLTVAIKRRKPIGEGGLGIELGIEGLRVGDRGDVEDWDGVGLVQSPNASSIPNPQSPIKSAVPNQRIPNSVYFPKTLSLKLRLIFSVRPSVSTMS